MLEQLAPVEPVVRENHCLHLIEQELARHAAAVPERLVQAGEYRRERLAWINAQPEESRVPQHHEQRVPLAPRELELGEVDLGLEPGVRLEPDDRLRIGPRPHTGRVVSELRGCLRDSRPPALRRTTAPPRAPDTRSNGPE